MSYLSHSTQRNIPWTYHASFPKRAVKKRDETYARAIECGWNNPERLRDCLTIYKFSDDEKTITLLPETAWPNE
jgi:hypothetical protein